ncbi:MAG TPA: ferric reductase-like transmembrane domain-containing protein [Solirubrobacteraceae bacterium]|jgi:DMSO/TMAO reductase YedYZ heme-binding membrane subunit|nr:ferric reductase-like transmembrane domain-containing protein [Solirubrobacteraceae bacterium]
MTGLAATLGPTGYWYLTRATGVVSLVLLTAVVVLGLLGPMRLAPNPRWPRFAVESLHRDLSLTAVALIVIHVITTVLDGFAPIGLIDAVIPFHSAYRPLWLGLGAVAFDLILALVITSLIRRRLGYRAWRAVHWLAYACWPVALLHGLGTGSDSRQLWALLVTFACVVAVSWAIIARLGRGQDVSPRWRGLGAAGAVLTPIGLIAFTLAGPLASRWAERAGTPSALLSHRPVNTVARVATSVPRSGSGSGSAQPLKLPFTSRLAGTITRTQAGGGAILDLELRLSGGTGGRLRIRLGGEPSGGGLSLSGSQVDLAADGAPAALVGHVTALDGTQVTARLTGGQKPVDLLVDLNIDNQNGTVSGTLHARQA